MRTHTRLLCSATLCCITTSMLRAQSANGESPARPAMERVTGIGGFFFKAKDPKALADWYEANLGVSKVPGSYGGESWNQEAGPTVFTGFPDDTKYFGAKAWMLNFRVRNLDAMVKQLRD